MRYAKNKRDSDCGAADARTCLFVLKLAVAPNISTFLENGEQFNSETVTN